MATGASARWLGIEGPYRGNGVSTCATCDGHFYRGKEIAVVGGGDSAVEEATFLTRFATKVTLIHRRDALRASKIMQDRVAKNPKIAYAWNSVVAEVIGEKQDGHQVLTGVKLRSTKDDSMRDLKIDGLFLAIGHVPNTAIFEGQLATTPDGYLLNRTALAWKGIEAAPGLLDTPAQLRHGDQCRGGVRLRRRRRHALPPGDHRGRLGLCGRHGLREMARIDRTRQLGRTLSTPCASACRLNDQAGRPIMHCRQMVARGVRSDLRAVETSPSTFGKFSLQFYCGGRRVASAAPRRVLGPRA